MDSVDFSDAAIRFPAEHASVGIFAKDDEIVIDIDFHGVTLSDSACAPQLLRDHDAAKIVDSANHPSVFHDFLFLS